MEPFDPPPPEIGEDVVAEGAELGVEPAEDLFAPTGPVVNLERQEVFRKESREAEGGAMGEAPEGSAR